LGYSDDDLTPPGSDRLVDDLLAYGTADIVAARLHEHLQCGADHVAVQVYGAADQVMPTLRELGALLKR
jgi:alkanesulfonate monooxygenase SsuD/methylene tetrahydromethanopterin reductase-like flavin-dependent oxidoreductase (luciferase family)